ncbi:MAG TPA: site-specific integrase [Firmicutes bacterium]|nr:site-specific integrase [Bacillota bacterium]
MASKLYRYRKNSWRFAVSQGFTKVTDPVTGKTRLKRNQKWFTITARTRKEAEAKMAEILDQLNKGTYVEPSKKTLAEFLREDFIPHLQAKGRSPSTVRGYQINIEQHIIPHLGDLPLEKIAPIHIEGWLNTVTLTNGGRPTARSLQYWRAILHRALEYAVEMDLLPRNPVDKVKPPKVERRKPESFSREELEKILDAAKSSRYYALIATAAMTGARLGELLALRWDAVDFEQGTITIRRTLLDTGNQRTGREPFFKETTKDNEIRVVPMAAPLVSILKNWRKRWIEERMAIGGGYFDRFNLVFPTETGWPMSESNINRDWKVIFEKAGVRKLSPHKLRHSFATRALDAGADLDTVAAILGHSSVLVTKQFYVDSREEAKKSAVNRLADFLLSTGSLDARS